MKYIRHFTDLSLEDISLVGGKTASLGEMISQLKEQDIKIPLGFAVTTDAYWAHLKENDLIPTMKKLIGQLETPINVSTLQKIGAEIRYLISSHPLPEEIVSEIKESYIWLSKLYNQPNIDVAVRSSATAEDLPTASFAGQQETYLNIKGFEELIEAIKNCMASLFTDRAIIYRIEKGFDHFKLALSVAVQKMVRSDKASSGVIFTLDTDSGFKNVVIVTSSYGLGESIVKGLVNPDEFHVHKPTLEASYKPIIKKFLGSKEIKFIYAENKKQTIQTISVDYTDKHKFSLTDIEILSLAKQAVIIENHYTKIYGTWSPMDIEWAKDGFDQQLYIVQARPETVHVGKRYDLLVKYRLKQPSENIHTISKGFAIGQKIANGRVKILKNINEHSSFAKGDILVTRMTDPDWVPIMKKASAIITDQGGRTCHAAIVSRELGIPAIVGTGDATEVIKDGEQVTIDCSRGSVGYIYNGKIDFEIDTTELKKLPKPKIPLMVNIANPDRAYELSFLPVSGVGLARVEFIISDFIKIHPMSVCEPEKIKDHSVTEAIRKLALPYKDGKDFFVQTLAQGIGLITAAFYPKPVIVRLSDFKSNEYRNLLGGEYYEPIEENPMLGFRGAVRYCDPAYAPAFALECLAIKKVIDEMGLKNLKLLVPFVRTPAEASCTIDALAEHGLKHKKGVLEILMMCEVPSNVIILEEFAKYFDGFSIGSNDLTQFTLAVDRDSALLSNLFNENDSAVIKMMKLAVKESQRLGKYISICGQAPSDYPEIADMLIKEGIDALSLNPDSVIPFLSRKV